MISEKMKPFMANNSAIRAMFEEGKRMAAVYGRENVYDFSLGNPNVPVPQVTEAILDVVKNEDFMTLHGYMSNAGYEDVRQTIAESLNKRFGTNFSFKNLIMTVGAASGLNIILKSILNPGDEVIVFAPYFVEYNAYVRNYDGNVVVISPDTETFMPKLDEFEAKITAKTKAVIINNPNNPTGRLIADDLLEEILRICREKNIALFVDECFLSLSDGGVDLTPSLSDVPQLFILKAFTKSFGMAGLRLGYGLSADEALLRKMSAAVPPWNVSTLAQAAGVAALGDAEFLEKNRTIIRAERPWLEEKLRKFGFWVCPSQVNYILFRGDVGLTEQLRARGVAIRDCANFEGLTSGWYRVAVRQYEENEQLIAAIRSVGKE